MQLRSMFDMVSRFGCEFVHNIDKILDRPIRKNLKKSQNDVKNSVCQFFYIHKLEI